MITQPLLAAKKPVFEKLTFPKRATPKIDGIRCVMEGDDAFNVKALSRSFKPIPNKFVRKTLEDVLPRGMDGELTTAGSFVNVVSGIMSHDGEPDFVYDIFDYVKDSLTKPYEERLSDLKEFYDNNPQILKFCRPVYGEIVNNLDELYAVMAKHTAAGYEGTMLRDLKSPYKCGRSSLKEGYLIAIKYFEDGEAEVIGFEEQMHNENEKTKDNFGHSERSSKQENMTPMDTLGAFVVRDLKSQETFKIGTGVGLTKELRKTIWTCKDNYLGKIVHYRYQAHGVKDKPRIPSWYGFRSPDDMS